MLLFISEEAYYHWNIWIHKYVIIDKIKIESLFITLDSRLLDII